jgi:hypothetical protein
MYGLIARTQSADIKYSPLKLAGLCEQAGAKIILPSCNVAKKPLSYNLKAAKFGSRIY